MELRHTEEHTRVRLTGVLPPGLADHRQGRLRQGSLPIFQEKTRNPDLNVTSPDLETMTKV